MADVAPKLKELIEDKEASEVIRGVIAISIYVGRQIHAGYAITPKAAFEKADGFMEEWKKQLK